MFACIYIVNYEFSWHTELHNWHFPLSNKGLWQDNQKLHVLTIMNLTQDKNQEMVLYHLELKNVVAIHNEAHVGGQRTEKESLALHAEIDGLTTRLRIITDEDESCTVQIRQTKHSLGEISIGLLRTFR